MPLISSISAYFRFYLADYRDGHGTGTRNKEHQSEARIFNGVSFTEVYFMNIGNLHPTLGF